MDKLQFANWSRAVGGAVHSLIMHQYGHSVGCEAQVQLHSSSPVPTGLKQEITGGKEDKKTAFFAKKKKKKMTNR